MKIGKRIKELRIGLGYTQLYVAQKLQIAQTNISAWERNDTRPEYENLAMLARLYETTTDYILGLEDEYGNKTKSEEEFTYTDGVHQITHKRKS